MNKRRNLAFTIETLALTLFLLLVLALLVQLFGAAQRLGLQARRETDAALILQNVTAELHAGAGSWAEALAAAAAGQGQLSARRLSRARPIPTPRPPGPAREVYPWKHPIARCAAGR